MCGIAGIYLKNPDSNYLSVKQKDDLADWLMCGIENRGTHATGIAQQNKEGVATLEKSDMEASKFIFWRQDVLEDTRAILIHTRLSTKGSPKNLLNNHPIEYKTIMAIHNGHISNDDELFAEEELERIAEVDSEIIPALLWKYTFNNPKEALEKMQGGFAIAAFDSANPGKLLLAKGSSSPLHYLETNDMWIWASEVKVIVDALKGALNFEAKFTDVDELKYGKYIVIDGEESEMNEFTPFFKTYSYNSGVNRGGAYSSGDGWSNLYKNGHGRDQCDECFVWFADHTLNEINKQKYCDHCEKKLFVVMSNGTRVPKEEVYNSNGKRLSKKERKRLRKQKARQFQESKPYKSRTVSVPNKPETVGDALDNEHWAVCQLVAQFYGTKTEFVDFMLFGDKDIEDYDDPHLVTMYLEFEEKYKELLDEIREETNKIIEDMSCQTSFPVGFGGV